MGGRGEGEMGGEDEEQRSPLGRGYGAHAAARWGNCGGIVGIVTLFAGLSAAQGRIDAGFLVVFPAIGSRRVRVRRRGDLI